MTPAEYNSILSALQKLIEIEREKQRGAEAALIARIESLEREGRKQIEVLQQQQAHVVNVLGRELLGIVERQGDTAIAVESLKKSIEGIPSAVATGIKRAYGPRLDAMHSRLIDVETKTLTVVPQPIEGSAS